MMRDRYAECNRLKRGSRECDRLCGHLANLRFSCPAPAAGRASFSPEIPHRPQSARVTLVPTTSGLYFAVSEVQQ